MTESQMRKLMAEQNEALAEVLKTWDQIKKLKQQLATARYRRKEKKNVQQKAKRK